MTRRKLTNILFVAILVGAALLRFPTLGWQSLWVDEVQTLEITRKSAGDVVVGAAEQNISPPLYFLLVWAGTRYQVDEVALRVASAIAGLLTIPLIGMIAGQILSRTASLTTMLVLCLSPFHIWYSQEARGYAVLILFVTLSMWFLLNWRQSAEASPGRSLGTRVGYVLSTTLALYTHLLALPVLAIHLVIVYQTCKNARQGETERTPRVLGKQHLEHPA